ncbi:MAG: hypothetical protein NTW52_01860 [Planctomycetota bacterium]|nr:hypothetical protein [Planctomycetota bacterium]
MVLVIVIDCTRFEYESQLTPEYEYENAEILDLSSGRFFTADG